ncbi:unnamed protein product [Blepharisma stoltei]|uniref:RanBP2-type domain-containing protein n=1 Tax=Blepharisma stoltei TaxID=1481888 RepID=A0AAU9K0V8_9CILI|nr:unnamed protein product [Blepharisma stoltei]
MSNYRKCEFCNESIYDFAYHQRTCRVKNKRASKDTDIPMQTKVYFRNKRGEDSAAVNTALYTLCYIKPLFQNIIKGYSGCREHQEGYVCLSCAMKRIFEEFSIKSNASGDQGVAYEVDVSDFYNEISNITDSVIGEKTPPFEVMFVITETLNILHHIYVQTDADENNPATTILCKETCPGHQVCDFRLKEIMKCQCLKTFSYTWNYSEFSYPTYILNIIEQLPAESSKLFFGVPKYRLMDHSASSSILPLLKKMPSFMRYQWESIDANECEDENCEIKISKRKAELISNPPQCFLSSIIWEKEKELDSVESLQVLSSIANNLALSEIFETPSRDNYQLSYLIFYREKSCILVIKRENDQWEFIEGNRKNIIVKWEKVIEEVLIKNLRLAGLAYVASEVGGGLELSQLKWLNLEKLAVEDKVYKEQHKGDVDLTEVKTNAKIINKPQQEVINYENLDKDEYVDLSEEIQKITNQDLEIVKPKETKNPFTNSVKTDYQDIIEKYGIAFEEEKKQNNLGMKNLTIGEMKKEDQFLELRRPKLEKETPKEKKWYLDDLREEEKKNSWKCPCGADNEESWEVCVKCNKIKEGSGGWACKFCTAINYNKYSNRCNVCFENQLAEQPLVNDYWNCTLCGTVNVSSYNLCSNCQELKTTDKWKCDTCSKVNYSWDKECISCSINQRMRLSNKAPLRREIIDFNCMSCKSKIKSDNYKYCWPCKRATDNCEHSEYPGNYICRDCQKQIWRCTKCRTENLPKKIECEKCMKSKQEERKEDIDVSSCSGCYKKPLYIKYCHKCLKMDISCTCPRTISKRYLCSSCRLKAEPEPVPVSRYKRFQ